MFRNLRIKRIRKVITPGFFAIFRYIEVPLDATTPQHNGYCLRPLPWDYLYILGTTADGKEKSINCGVFSDALLKAVNEQIEKQNSEQSLAPYGAQRVEDKPTE